VFIRSMLLIYLNSVYSFNVVNLFE